MLSALKFLRQLRRDLEHVRTAYDMVDLGYMSCDWKYKHPSNLGLKLAGLKDVCGLSKLCFSALSTCMMAACSNNGRGSLLNLPVAHQSWVSKTSYNTRVEVVSAGEFRPTNSRKADFGGCVAHA